MTTATGHGPFIKDFVTHLERTRPTPEPVYQTMVHASAPQGDWSDFSPAWHLQRLPLGRAWFYPGFFVFLSSSRLKAGQIPRGGQFALKMLETYSEMSMGDHVLRLSTELAGRLPSQADKRLARWLSNPNSLVVPTSTVGSIERHKGKAFVGQSQWIELTSAGRRIILSPPNTIGGREMAGAIGAQFGRVWEPRLYELLGGVTR